ncbi:MAG TPA: YmfQ family protein [Thermoanaerobacterium sp.]|nr:YmfQ family protein [Thermoanaerobacterium sp.]
MSDITNYVPPFILQSKIFQAIYNAENIELNNVNYSSQDLSDQCFIDTATWGLEYWEKFLGVDVDKTKSDAFRRERIKAKIRGYGTITKEFIQNVASSFANGEVEVIEYPNEYKFIIKFVGIKGIPPNMPDLTKTIEEIKPAHLSYEYQYTYNVWNFLSSKVWNDLTPYTWDQVRVI